MDQSMLPATFSLLSQDFELPVLQKDFEEEMAIGLLSKAISHLLDRDFERLLQICYRIDLGEKHLKKILYEANPDQVAAELARALWHRQKQKIEIRRRYAEDQNQ
jgi:hypothetical protein